MKIYWELQVITNGTKLVSGLFPSDQVGILDDRAKEVCQDISYNSYWCITKPCSLLMVLDRKHL